MRPTEKMPTAGKLVAGVALAGLAYYASGLVIANWPQDHNFGFFREFSALVAALMGWRVIGGRVGNGWMGGIGAGLTGLFALLFWLFLLLPFYEMIQRSLDLRYKGPVEAVEGMFGIAFEYLQNVAHADLGLTLVIGSMMVGLLAEAVARRAS